MLRTKPTEHLAGITMQGDYKDFYKTGRKYIQDNGIRRRPDRDLLWS